MILHTVISEYDIFRGGQEQAPASKSAKKQVKIVPLVTDPKKFINRKSRIN